MAQDIAASTHATSEVHQPKHGNFTIQHYQLVHASIPVAATPPKPPKTSTSKDQTFQRYKRPQRDKPHSRSPFLPRLVTPGDSDDLQQPHKATMPDNARLFWNGKADASQAARERFGKVEASLERVVLWKMPIEESHSSW